MNRMGGGRLTGLRASLLCCLLALLPAPLRAQAAPVVLVLPLHDTIQPVSAEYLERGVRTARQRDAALLVVELDTPGGLLDSTRTMVAAIEGSPVPIAVYVAPAGARAGSAGLFLLEAADVAAMAPGTNAGASHPVLEGRSLDPVMKQKLENDAAAFLRSTAVPRGRNAEAAEQAVRESKSWSDAECLRLHLVDLVVPSVPALLHSLDGTTIHRFDGSARTLALRGAVVEQLAPSLRERVLGFVADPNIAVLLLLVGIFLIYAEFNMPGTIVPGALGALLVMLALFGLNLLPVHHASVALLLAAAALLAAELKVPSHGIVAGAGIAVLVAGLATLVEGPIGEQRVHLSTAIAAGVGFGLISFLLARIALLARRNKSLMGPQALLGRMAMAHTALAPTGQVLVRGELWQAESETGYAAPGSAVLVTAVEGLLLKVGPAGANQAVSPVAGAGASAARE